MKYIDFHRHTPFCSNDVLEIQNVNLQDLPKFQPDSLFTCGLHPWHLEQLTLKECLNLLTGAVNLPGLIAIGECGLDKNTDYPLELQQDYFRLHIMLARQFHKPLIVHCVRRHGELLQLLKAEKFKEPVTIHGFDSKPSVAEQLAEHGIRFSFGSALLKPHHPAAEVLAEQTAGSYFLETDDDIYPIEKIYARAAEIQGCTINQLIEEVYSAFQNAFSIN